MGSPETRASGPKTRAPEHHGIHAIDDEDQEKHRHTSLEEALKEEVLQEDLDAYNSEDELPNSSWTSKLVASEKFEVCLAIVIVGNIVCMIIGLDLRGEHFGHSLGLADAGSWSSAEAHLRNLEYIFNFIYLIEMAIRVAAHGTSFCHSLANMFDAFIVVTSCLDIFVLNTLDVGSGVISVLRVFRLARLLRLLKFVKHSHHAKEFRVIILTLTQALRGTVWCAVVLAGVIGTGAVIMTQMVGGYLDDESVTLERRRWMFNMFGTNMRSAHSMFICTFTGSWYSYSRPLIEEVGGHGTFAVFWIMWVMVANFMTMRVIAALFLRQTMAVVSNDEERTAMRNMKNKEMFATRLNTIFESADASGDGEIGVAEFEKMMKDPIVVASFAKLDLDVDEVSALFTVLSSDDGSADYNEFLHGALKMNSSASIIDSVQVMHKQMKMSKGIDDILEEVRLLKQHHCGGQRG
jgi:Ca2+-binding EF-hand superfamily protein